MKYIFLISLFLASAFLALGQQIKLRVLNPLPRVNDEIQIQFSTGSKSTKGAKRQGEIQGRIKFTEFSSKTGIVTIGPLKLLVNGQLHESNKVELNVAPELPENILDGIWISQIIFDSLNYLIVEQRISQEAKSERTSQNEILINGGSGQLFFAELDEEMLENKGISILSIESASGKKIVKLKDHNLSFAFKNTVYQLESSRGEAIKITKANFKHFPDNVKFDGIVMR